MPVTRGDALLQPRIEEFLTFCGARNLSPNTVRAYRADLAKFLALCGGSEIRVGDINRKLVRNFVARLHDSDIARSSIHRKLAAVKSLCKWLENEGLLEASLIDSITGPRRRDQLPDVPSEADMKRLLDGEIPGPCPERDRVILELLYGSGLRVAELCGLNLDDFRDEDVILVRGKGKKERLVILGEYAQAAIQAWLPARAKWLEKLKLQMNALLCSVGPRHSIERLDVRTIGRVLKQVAEAKGLPEYHPHLLRHACGTHMHDHGAPLQAVATFLGHARLSTAQIYTRVSVGRMMETYKKAHPHAGLAHASPLSKRGPSPTQGKLASARIHPMRGFFVWRAQKASINRLVVMDAEVPAYCCRCCRGGRVYRNMAIIPVAQFKPSASCLCETMMVRATARMANVAIRLTFADIRSTSLALGGRFCCRKMSVSWRGFS